MALEILQFALCNRHAFRQQPTLQEIPLTGRA
jgi:hypothetical protein